MFLNLLTCLQIWVCFLVSCQSYKRAAGVNGGQNSIGAVPADSLTKVVFTRPGMFAFKLTLMKHLEEEDEQEHQSPSLSVPSASPPPSPKAKSPAQSPSQSQSQSDSLSQSIHHDGEGSFIFY